VLLYQALGIEDVGLLGLGLRHALHTATVLGLRVFGRFLAPSTKVETWNYLSLAVIMALVLARTDTSLKRELLYSI
jgi:hypothetical protein